MNTSVMMKGKDHPFLPGCRSRCAWAGTIGARRAAWITAAIAALEGPAGAHPFGDRYAAQRVDVRLDRAGLDVGYIADVPIPLLPSHAGAADPDAMLAELATGLTITVDGASVPTRVAHSAQRMDLVSMNARVLELVLRADVDLTGAHTLEITNGNIPAVPCYHFADVQTAPSLRVTKSSLRLPALGGKIMDFSRQWSRSELRRRVQLTLDGDPGWVAAQIDAWAPDARRPLAASDDAEAWRLGADSVRTVEARLALALCAGLGAGAAGRRWLTAVVALAALATVGASLGPVWAAPGALFAALGLAATTFAPLPPRARLAVALLLPLGLAGLSRFGVDRPVDPAPATTIDEAAP